MSNAAINWSKQFDLPRREKFILLVLCERADPAGHCFPSIAQLATDTSMSERSIQAGLRVLEARGLVVITGKGGRGMPSRYAVQSGRVVAFDPPTKRVQNKPERVQERVQKSTERVQITTQKGANDDTPHRVHSLSSLDSEREPEERVPPKPPVAKKPAPPLDLLADLPPVPDAVDRAVAIWNDVCAPNCGKVLRVVNGRRATFLKRFAEDFGSSVSQWEEYCLRIARSDFLTGKKIEWQADFDWVLKPAHVTRIIEGKYDNRAGVDLFADLDRLHAEKAAQEEMGNGN